MNDSCHISKHIIVLLYDKDFHAHVQCWRSVWRLSFTMLGGRNCREGEVSKFEMVWTRNKKR